MGRESIGRRPAAPIPARGLKALLLGGTAALALAPGALRAQEDQTVTLAPITVEGTEDDQTTIVATETSAGSGMATDILDTPASVSVITAAEIRARGATDVEQVLQYSPGVVTDFYGSDDRFDFFRIRGFDANSYRDGLSLGSAFGGVREETYAYERVEVVRGANSTTFGVSDPGGSVNFVSKLPKQSRYGEAYATVGSFDKKEVGFDFGDDIGEAGTLSWRVTGLLRDAEKEYDHSRDDETFLMAGLTWRPTDLTSLSLVIDHLDKDGVPGSGGHPVGTDFDRSVFFGEPDFNYRGTDRDTLTLLFDHDFGGGLTFGASARYSDIATDFGYVYVGGTSGGTTATRSYYANDSQGTDFVADAHLQYDTAFGGVESRTLGGIEVSRTEQTSTSWFTGADPIDWTNPVYSGGIDLGSLAPYAASRTEDEGSALYLQQELTFAGRWIVTAGLRHDWLDVERTNLLTSATSSASYSEDTARLGVTYKVSPDLSVYGSYAESVVPASIGLDPERGEQLELGVKYRPVGTNALFSAALYDLSKTNITRTNPATLQDETIGEVRVRGLDLEARVEMTDRLALTAGYSWLDSEIVENGTSGNEGNQLAFVPEHMASLWLNYDLPGAGARGDMTLGLGARYTGSYNFDDANTMSTKAAVIYDASLSYQVSQATEFSLSVTNLTDEKHVAYGGFGADFYNPGRAISATLRRTW
ncbi:MAG: TonB-dependent siderophore receptor [Rhodobacteraceae bacterium]|nr:TonB-dependent siderophore receptor [Paracoccaceae bacterium]MBR9820063.1 TonB-dependent siderophore receptor [Paracoccaceae bacterium]